jgi:hypothetical protein
MVRRLKATQQTLALELLVIPEQTMKTLLKIYSGSCLIVAAFFIFFQIPWGILPFSDAVNVMLVGGVMAACAGFYVLYIHKREGFEFGWFLANRGGFWIIAAVTLGLVILACGILLFVSPEMFVPAFEQGALPFGIVLVSMFWLALIFMFAFLAFGMIGRATAYARLLRFSDVLVQALIASFCLALAGVFFSLFLEVLTDILIRISVNTQWRAIWVFVSVLTAAGIIQGLWKKPSDVLDKEEINKTAVEQ